MAWIKKQLKRLVKYCYLFVKVQHKHLRSTSETMYFIHMYFVAFCALVLYKDDYNNFKSYLICAGGALAVSEIYSWMKNISNRSTTVSRLKHD